MATPTAPASRATPALPSTPGDGCLPGPQGIPTARITAPRASDAYAAANTLLRRLEPLAPGQLPANLLGELNADICALRSSAAAERAKKHTGWLRGNAERNSNERAAQSELIANTLELAREQLAADSRSLGRRPAEWSATVAAQTQTITRELAGVRAGDAAAQQRLDAAYAALRGSLQALQSETSSDTAHRTRLDNGVATFERQYVGTLFDGTEKGLVSTARRYSGALGDEIQEQQALQQRIRSSVRDAAAEQLRVDPRFASHGMAEVATREQKWASTVGPANEMSAAAQRLAQLSQEHGAARNDATRLPAVIAQAERESQVAQAAVVVNEAAYIAQRRVYDRNSDVYERQIRQAAEDRRGELATIESIDRKLAVANAQTNDPWTDTSKPAPQRSNDPWGDASPETLRRQRAEAVTRANAAAQKGSTAESRLEEERQALRQITANRDVALSVALEASRRVSSARQSLDNANSIIAAAPTRIPAQANAFNSAAQKYEAAVVASGLAASLQPITRVPDARPLLDNPAQLLASVQTTASQAEERATAARNGHNAVITERNRLIDARANEVLGSAP